MDRFLETVGHVIGVVLVQALVTAVASMLFGLFLMLAVGVVHHEWIAACPTIGYWWAVVLVFLIRAALYQLPERDS